MTTDFRSVRVVERATLRDSELNAAIFETDGGPLRVEAYAEGVFRMRFGGAGGADYGLLATAPAALPLTVEREGETIRLRAGDMALELAPDPLHFTLSRGGRTALRTATDGHFVRRFRLPPFGRSEAGWVAAFDLRSGEPVYGLGEKWGPLNHRGQLVVSRDEDALGVNAEISYKNAPFAWSPEGWGLLINTPATVTHGVGFAPWSHRSYAVEVADEVMDLFLIAAETPAAILERFRALTGPAPEVPRWSLGVWISRAYYKTAEEAMEVATQVRARRIPCDVLTLDGRAWLVVDTRFGFEWDAGRYPDPKAFTDGVKAMGFRICAWEYPLVSVKNPLFGELAAKGWLLKDGKGDAYRYEWDLSPFGKVLTPLPESGIVDFTHPDAAAWFADSHEKLFDSGLDVMKTDFGEQVPDDAVAHNGDTGRRLHNVYPLLYNRCVYQATRRRFGNDALVWGRSGWIGSHTCPMQWGGDPQADWEGLAASIRGGLSWGLSGVPYYAHDIGGFYGGPPDPELYVRWIQAGVLCSHTRIHGIGPREPWFFGEEAERIARDWLEFRYRLLPYLEEAVADAAACGLPVMRAMPLAFPNDRAAWAFDEQYMLGRDLLVAPVLRPGGRVNVYLPQGSWYDFETGEVFEGNRVHELTFPIERTGLFAREGAVVPLGSVVQHTGELAGRDTITDLRIFGMPGRDGGTRSIRVSRNGEGVRVSGAPPGARFTAIGNIRIERGDSDVRVIAKGKSGGEW